MLQHAVEEVGKIRGTNQGLYFDDLLQILVKLLGNCWLWEF
jgi:hypothetical protein